MYIDNSVERFVEKYKNTSHQIREGVARVKQHLDNENITLK